MQEQNETAHTNYDELMKIKIPALGGIAASNTKLVLESVAMNGPMLKYGIFQRSGLHHESTVSRRVDNLKKRGYLAEARTRLPYRGRQTEEIMYGLTWKGLIASISIEHVRSNIITVLKNNPLLHFPEKDVVLEVIQSLYRPEEIEAIVTALFYGFLSTNSPSIEAMNEEDLKFWIIPTLRASSPFSPKNLKGKEIEDLFDLLDNPKILQYAKDKIVPFIAATEQQLRDTYIFVRLGNELAQFISTLEVKDRPSERTREYLPKLLSQLEEMSQTEQGE